MNKFKFSKKRLKLIIQNKTLRITSILIIALLLMITILSFTGASFSKKVKLNEDQILDAKTQLAQLEQLVSKQEDNTAERIKNREFAPYTEIVPFIGLLESLFAIIDPSSEIRVKNQESEIYINRYADYEVQLNPRGKMEIFERALDELHKLKYLTKIVNFEMQYDPPEEGKPGEIKEVILTIRLYFD